MKTTDTKNLKNFSDEELCSLAQNSNNDAFNILVSRYIISTRSRTLSYKDSGIDRDDLAQEGLIGLMSAIRSYEPQMGASFKTFAWLCIDRSIISAVKSVFRKKQIPSSSLVSLIENDTNFSHDDLNPLSILIAKEDLKNFMNKVKVTLTDFEQSVLNLYLSGNSYAEISHKLNVQIKSVDNALSRIRRKLK